MNTLPKVLHNLISKLQRLPGLGPKSSARISMHLIKMPGSYKKELGDIISKMDDEIVCCKKCFNLATDMHCEICESADRDQTVVNIVEDPLDVLAFEQGADYKGVYHVLGGVISPVNGIGPDELRISELISRIRGKSVKEIIISTNPNIEGEATAMYMKEEIENLNIKNIKITRLAMGLPTGADLEYADKSTLKKALEGRTNYV